MQVHMNSMEKFLKIDLMVFPFSFHLQKSIHQLLILNSILAKGGSVFIGFMIPGGAISSKIQRTVI